MTLRFSSGMRGAAAALALALAAIVAAGGTVVCAQGRPGRPLRLPPDSAVGVTPAEIQRMFEAVALVRAQEALKLSDERYIPFLAKFKALQEVRRRNLQDRAQTLRELNRLVNEASDEAAIKDKLKTLGELDVRSEGELHKAYEAIDAVLDVPQQARFRLFEEQTERQKVNLLMRARAGRGGATPPPSQNPQ